MKDAPITVNGIHPITKMATPAPAATAPKVKDEAKKPSIADKLYTQKLGLRGKPKE